MGIVLAVMSHPDDEVIGCGGALAKHVLAGDAVAVTTFTDGVGSRGGDATERREEWLAALRVLGVMDAPSQGGGNDSASWVRYQHGGGWFEARYADQHLDMVPLVALSREVSRAIEIFGPQVVYTHWLGDLNQDHQRIAQAVLIATRPVTGSRVRRVLACEIPESTLQAFGGPAFAPTVFVSLTAEEVQRKQTALACYVSEGRCYPHPRSEQAVAERIRMWGGIAGVDSAEAFVLLREVL